MIRTMSALLVATVSCAAFAQGAAAPPAEVRGSAPGDGPETAAAPGAEEALRALLLGKLETFPDDRSLRSRAEKVAIRREKGAACALEFSNIKSGAKLLCVAPAELEAAGLELREAQNPYPKSAPMEPVLIHRRLAARARSPELWHLRQAKALLMDGEMVLGYNAARTSLILSRQARRFESP